MPAQNGGALVLSYGAQGTRQAGSAVLLATVPVITTQRLIASTHAPWATPAAAILELAAPSPAANFARAGAVAVWRPPAAQDRIEASSWIHGAIADQVARAPWGQYDSHPALDRLAGWIRGTIADQVARAPWGQYDSHPALDRLAGWLRGTIADQVARAPWGGPMAAADRRAVVVYAAASRRDGWPLRAPWSRVGAILRRPIEIVIPVHEGAPEALYVVPVQRVYMQVNTASLRRVDTDEPVRAYSLSLSLDADSWAWSFNASIPGADLALVKRAAGDSPIELEATLNGFAVRVLVESISRDRTHPNTRIAIGGRGKIAQLDAPYAPVLNFANADPRTAQQLVADVLTFNGEPLGWSVDWRPDDWLVPAGVFSQRGSYMAAINAIAQAAGAYVQPHATDNALAIVSRYPSKPWEWAGLDPDYELPSAVMTREATEWIEKPAYNRVFVSGVQAGYLGQITRAGTAGDVLADLVADPLMTAPAALRNRAMPILCDVGSQAHVTLSFPVLTGDGGAGVVLPGALVRYVDDGATRVGLSRSIELAASFGDRESKIRQTIKVETHE